MKGDTDTSSLLPVNFSMGTQKVLKGTQTKIANTAYLSPLRAGATGFKSRNVRKTLPLRTTE